MLDPWSRRIDLRHAHLGRIPVTWRSPVAKADAPGNDYQWLHDIADSAVPAVRRAFLQAIERVRGTVKEADLVAAIEARDVDQVIRVLGLDQEMPAALSATLQPPLEDEFIEAGRAAIEHTLPTAMQATISFDLTNPASLTFLRGYGMGLIRQVTQQTRDAVRQVVIDAFQEGGHPTEQAREIRQFIGLTQRQAQAAANYRDALVEEARPADQIERMVERYRQRLLRLRAETIARTETIRAANAGQHALWQQAADSQRLNRLTARRKWTVALDDRLCPFCAVVPLMNPAGVPIDGMFQTPLGPVSYPPLHPNCRCAQGLTAF